MNTCADCKFANFEDRDVYTDCEKIEDPHHSEPSTDLAYAKSCCCGGGLMVKREFGCAMFDARA